MDGKVTTTGQMFSGQPAKSRCMICGAFGEVQLCANHADALHQALTYHKIDITKPHPKANPGDEVVDMTKKG